VVADQFYAERLYSCDELLALLRENDFENVRQLQALATDSTRNQDLGMMARRNLITGVVSKPVTAVIQSGKNRPIKIAVLMGDPQLVDRVKPGASFDEDDYHTINELKQALARLSEYRFDYFDNHARLISDLPKLKRDYDLVFNLCDEGYDNDPHKELHVPALLEMLGIDYTGGNPQCLAYCYDKSLIRGLAQEMDIPVADAYLVKPEDTAFIDITIPFPVIIKPNVGDSSFGITRHCVCNNVTELDRAIQDSRTQFGYRCPVLIEQFLTGKDISVGIIGNPETDIEFLPIIEEDYSALPPEFPRICGYEAKWDPSSPYWNIRSIPADLPESTKHFLQASCLKLFTRLGCRDYARFDWRLDDNGTPRLLEVNPNPGWCWDGHLAKMAKLAGISYADMLRRIIDAAILRTRVEHAPATEVKVANA